MSLPGCRHSVIMYGTDAGLLLLRSMFLRRHGYDVYAVSSPVELADELTQPDHPYELLFISHTVSASCRDAAAALASQMGIPVYHLRTGISPDDWLKDLSRLLDAGHKE